MLPCWQGDDDNDGGDGNGNDDDIPVVWKEKELIQFYWVIIICHKIQDIISKYLLWN